MDDHFRDPFEPLTDQERKAAAAPASTPDGEPIVPIPADAPSPPLRRKRLGEPVGSWTYCNAPACETVCYNRALQQGRRRQGIPTLHFVATARRPSGVAVQKTCRSRDRSNGLEVLAARPDARVMITEGEGKCDNRTSHLSPTMSSYRRWAARGAASKTDWKPPGGPQRSSSWPDNDPPGAGFRLHRWRKPSVASLNCNGFNHRLPQALAQLAVDGARNARRSGRLGCGRRYY